MCGEDCGDTTRYQSAVLPSWLTVAIRHHSQINVLSFFSSFVTVFLQVGAITISTAEVDTTVVIITVISAHNHSFAIAIAIILIGLSHLLHYFIQLWGISAALALFLWWEHLPM